MIDLGFAIIRRSKGDPPLTSAIPALPAFTFLHGPTGVGKTTLAFNLAKLAEDPRRVSMYHHAEPLYWAATTILEEAIIHPYDKNAGEWKKKRFPGGMTGREVLIDLGNLFRGANPAIFGELAVEEIHNIVGMGAKHIIFDAVRVPEDVAPIYDTFPSHSALFITVRRKGMDFTSDLGSYFAPTGQFCTEVHVEEGRPDYAVSILRPALAQAASMGRGL